MDIDKWEQLKEELKRKYTVESETTEDLIVETGDGPVKQGHAEAIVFINEDMSPQMSFKLVFETRPVVTDKKVIYSHRAGQGARTEYEFSETEKSHKLKAYTWDDDKEEWKEIDAGNFA
jgi:hypothetical protein